MKISLDEVSIESKTLIIIGLVAVACILTYYFHFILKTGIVFSQFYYIPIVISAFWWKKRGIWIAVFLSILLLVSEFILPLDSEIIDVYRAIMLISVSVITVFISERVEQSQLQLAESEERYRNIVETTHEGVLIGDLKGNILYANQRMCELFGYEKDEIENHSISRFLDKDNLQAMVDIRKKINKGEKVSFYTEFRIKNGQILWTLAQGSPLYDDKKNHVANLFMHSDITELKKTQQALEQSHSELEEKVKTRTRKLAESEEKYRTLFDNDPSYTVLIDLDGVIVDANKALTDLVGLSKSELIGKSYSKLKSVLADDENFLDKLAILSSGKKIEPFETKFKDKRGSTHSVLMHVTPILENEELNYFLAMATDITEQKNAEKEIISSLMQKESLLREIHHRVKNNMQVISSLISLQTVHATEEETKDVLMDIQSRVKSMTTVHEHLYSSNDFSHINFREYVQKLVFDIFYNYRTSISNINPILDIDDIQLNMETAIPLGLIINELVINSIKFAFPDGNGSIIVKLQSKNSELYLTVADDGIGLPEGFDLGKTPFLGLQLVNNLIRQIDGTITLDQTRGTKYQIIFKELKYKERLDLNNFNK